jgi:hypothetical protein
MKSKRVATQNAGSIRILYRVVKNSVSIIYLSFALIIISCDKYDDLPIFGVEPPVPNESPPVNQSPTNQPPVNEESIIVYTNLEPDFISENIGDFYNLDLNNDKIIDFTIRAESDEGWEFLIIGSGGNDANGIISVSPWYTYAIPLNSGQEIFNLRGYRNGESYSTWGILLDCLTFDNNCSTYWKDKANGYVGLKFIINGGRHYGWVQINVTSVTQWTIIDYAYNATPNKPILAGQRE